MGLSSSPAAGPEAAGGIIALTETGGGEPGVPESFTIEVAPGRVQVRGADACGLRDGIVRLVDLIGLRQAPFLVAGSTTFRPRLPVRLGAVPHLGSYRDLVFLGYNAIFASGGDLYAVSRSDAIPALIAVQRRPSNRPPRRASAGSRPSPSSTPGRSSPGTRSSSTTPNARRLTWSADGATICTEHPLVQRYLSRVWRLVPPTGAGQGGADHRRRGFYHCFMRPFGMAKGHTNCPRCEALGPDTVVANLVNLLGAAARRVNPKALAVAWPYSAEHVWSADRARAVYVSWGRAGRSSPRSRRTSG
jgi:hypothetical protein